MADTSKSATSPRHQGNATVNSGVTGQATSQRWLREFRMPMASEATDTATPPVRRHIDEYA